MASQKGGRKKQPKGPRMTDLQKLLAEIDASYDNPEFDEMVDRLGLTRDMSHEETQALRRRNELDTEARYHRKEAEYEAAHQARLADKKKKALYVSQEIEADRARHRRLQQRKEFKEKKWAGAKPYSYGSRPGHDNDEDVERHYHDQMGAALYDDDDEEDMLDGIFGPQGFDHALGKMRRPEAGPGPSKSRRRDFITAFADDDTPDYLEHHALCLTVYPKKNRSADTGTIHCDTIVLKLQCKEWPTLTGADNLMIVRVGTTDADDIAAVFKKARRTFPQVLALQVYREKSVSGSRAGVWTVFINDQIPSDEEQLEDLATAAAVANGLYDDTKKVFGERGPLPPRDKRRGESAYDRLMRHCGSVYSEAQMGLK